MKSKETMDTLSKLKSQNKVYLNSIEDSILEVESFLNSMIIPANSSETEEIEKELSDEYMIRLSGLNLNPSRYKLLPKVSSEQLEAVNTLIKQELLKNKSFFLKPSELDQILN